MKIHNARGTWTVEGKKVYLIPSDRPLNAVEMKALHPDVETGTRSYDMLRSPSKYHRVVLLKDNGVLVMVPMTENVQVVEITEDT